MHYFFTKTTIKSIAYSLLISLIGFVESKAALPSSLKKLKKGIYEEDLALYRIKCDKQLKPVKRESVLPLFFALDQTKKLEKRLAQRKAAYDHIGRLKGYTIQLYMGSSRTKALKIQELVSGLVYPSEFAYRQPYYTVQLGFFPDKLEAYLLCLTLKRKIPSAMIRPCICSRQVYLDAILYARQALSSQSIIHGSLCLE